MKMLKKLIGIVFTGQLLVFGQCPVETLAARVPQTGQIECIERWTPDALVVIAEKDCDPCRKLLDRMKRENFKRKKIEVIWLESQEKACLEQALKALPFARSWCASRKEVGRIWQINSTPQVFWMEGKTRREQVGFLDKTMPLPWNVPAS